MSGCSTKPSKVSVDNQLVGSYLLGTEESSAQVVSKNLTITEESLMKYKWQSIPAELLTPCKDTVDKVKGDTDGKVTMSTLLQTVRVSEGEKAECKMKHDLLIREIEIRQK